MTNNSRVCTSAKIWDLHIHSNQCSSYQDEYKDKSVTEYVDALVSLFSKFPDLEMVSFTDHNLISFELYKECIEREGFPNLIPGVEIDVQIAEDEKSKHLVAYFDAINDIEKIKRLSSELNTYFTENNIGPHNPIPIDTMLDQLLDLKIPFTLSPHAMQKQGERAFDYNWHHLDAEESIVYKYVDQFFSFWETSGKSNIAHAIQFLKEMNCGNKVSVVIFSDSHKMSDLERFLANPPQYFHSLPNYMGLRLVGTDPSRIFKDNQALHIEETGKYIGSIQIDSSKITLSPRLNAIIGGRGSGKSVLLDALAISLDTKKNVGLPQARIDFISKQKIATYNLNGDPILSGSLSFDYFNQSYISNIFNLEWKAYSEALMRYFGDAFSIVPEINLLGIEADYKTVFSTLFEEFLCETPNNISGLVEKYVVDRNDSLDIQILKKMKPTVEKGIAPFDYISALNKVNTAIEKALPAFLKTNKDIKSAIDKLDQIIVEQSAIMRNRYLTFIKPTITLIDSFHEKKKQLNEAQAKRNEIENAFEKTFVDKSNNAKNRVAIIRAYLLAEKGFKSHYEERIFRPGKESDSFYFVKTLDIVSPIRHFMKLCNDYFLVDKIPTENRNLAHLEDYINEFCFNEDGYKKDCNWKTLYEELKEYNLTYTPAKHIEYKTESGYVDISTQSPGTQANILLEFIVHSDSTNPLLIDQPEDNVDNQTIFNDIRSWFSKIKSNRQVIVVTHDANIVINADAENIIIANQKAPGVFQYQNGALEHHNNLDEAAKILDGGKNAVKRRLMKYGE